MGEDGEDEREKIGSVERQEKFPRCSTLKGKKERRKGNGRHGAAKKKN